ncbi:hypothetical protein CAEBREN_09950 [Caenorhabditis brenneri]|uniref:Uncharacterized protein n=1 Tax=Caenorhabditis brenneri TaxID=135651 RepID=G0NGE6_CAEBE|nr:hypothetical protein CAEBREN_09950 [Caenorhabditis brenneri]
MGRYQDPSRSLDNPTGETIEDKSQTFLEVIEKFERKELTRVVPRIPNVDSKLHSTIVRALNNVDKRQLLKEWSIMMAQEIRTICFRWKLGR